MEGLDMIVDEWAPIGIDCVIFRHDLIPGDEEILYGFF